MGMHARTCVQQHTQAAQLHVRLKTNMCDDTSASLSLTCRHVRARTHTDTIVLMHVHAHACNYTGAYTHTRENACIHTRLYTCTLT